MNVLWMRLYEWMYPFLIYLHETCKICYILYRKCWAKHGCVNLFYSLSKYLKINYFLNNILRLDSEERMFPVKHYESVFDLKYTQIFRIVCKRNFCSFI